jgi:hypothetical protein
MKKLTVVLALAGALSAVGAAEYAPQEFDFSELGTVESVREMPVVDPLRDAFEHAVKPQTTDEVVIRIDDGRALVLRQDEMRRFAPGQRVRLVSGSSGARLERE